MIVPARKVDAFLAKHAHRLTDPILRIQEEEVSSLSREARMLLYGANAKETVLLQWFLASCEGRLGNLETALELLQKVRAASPENVAVLVDLGAALGRVGRSSEALECFRKAELVAEDAADRAVACVNQAVALRDLGRHAEGEAVLRAMLSSSVPTEYGALVRFAEASLMLDREGDAVEFLARAFCAKADRPRGDAPALEIIDLFAPDFETRPGTPTALAAAVRAVRERELADPPADMKISARVVLEPEAWDAFARLRPFVFSREWHAALGRCAEGRPAVQLAALAQSLQRLGALGVLREPHIEDFEGQIRFVWNRDDHYIELSVYPDGLVGWYHGRPDGSFDGDDGDGLGARFTQAMEHARP